MKPIDKIAWILIKDRKVLFARTKDRELFYTIGGKRKENETDLESLQREVKEEVCVNLIPETIKYLHTFKDQAHGKSEGVMVEIKCYTGDFIGTLSPSNEIEEISWFTTEDMHKNTLTGKAILNWLNEKNLID